MITPTGTEYKDPEIELVLENLDISSFNLLPSHVYIRNITDVDITTSTAAAASHAKVGTLTHVHIEALASRCFLLVQRQELYLGAFRAHRSTCAAASSQRRRS